MNGVLSSTVFIELIILLPDVTDCFLEDSVYLLKLPPDIKYIFQILIILGVLCLITGLMGCILPFLPGPPVAYLGLVLLHFTDKVQYTTTQLIVWLLIVLVVQVLDYFTPMLGSKYSGGSRWGNWGCIIGTLIGLLFLPWGVIFGPFLGAVIGELLGNKEFSQALRSGVGSLIGFLLGTFLKFVVCGYFCYQFIVGFIRS